MGDDSSNAKKLRSSRQYSRQTDPRFRHPNVKWKFRRNQVEQMVGFEAKRAGSMASKNMKAMDINWVTFEGGDRYETDREPVPITKCRNQS